MFSRPKRRAERHKKKSTKQSFRTLCNYKKKVWYIWARASDLIKCSLIDLQSIAHFHRIMFYGWSLLSNFVKWERLFNRCFSILFDNNAISNKFDSESSAPFPPLWNLIALLYIRENSIHISLYNPGTWVEWF